ncbi:MAG: hypothetical protein JWM42_2997 [Burkholderia sp.]|nr:hypothetical protein [Burkholderia sp.]
MGRTLLKLVPAVLLAWGTLTTPAWAQNAARGGEQNMKYKVNLPPSADLVYAIKAKQSGIRVDGDATVRWTASGNKFEIRSETRASLVGKILDAKSEGSIDDYGLAPVSFTEKRFRKAANTTSFDRAAKKINFASSAQSYPLAGGEQDRSSALWQLISVARAAPSKFKAGSEWRFVVAGHSDAEPWIFKVLKQDKVRTPMGELSAVHVARAAPPDSKEQKLDIWLAPSLEWYPVRVRFAEADGDFIEQTLQEAKKRP